MAPQWEPTALRGLSDRLALELRKDRTAEGLASRALVDVLSLLYRYQELGRIARHALDQKTKDMLSVFSERCDRQAAGLARLIEVATELSGRTAA